jgi:hypothetical protein
LPGRMAIRPRAPTATIKREDRMKTQNEHSRTVLSRRQILALAGGGAIVGLLGLPAFAEEAVAAGGILKVAAPQTLRRSIPRPEVPAMIIPFSGPCTTRLWNGTTKR